MEEKQHPNSPITPRSISIDELKEIPRPVAHNYLYGDRSATQSPTIGYRIPPRPTRLDTLERKAQLSHINNTWQCCGSDASVDRRLIQFVVQFIIALFVLSFCAVKLSGECQNTEVYLVLLSSIMGFYLNTVSSLDIPKKN